MYHAPCKMRDGYEYCFGELRSVFAHFRWTAPRACALSVNCAACLRTSGELRIVLAHFR